MGKKGYSRNKGVHWEAGGERAERRKEKIKVISRHKLEKKRSGQMTLEKRKVIG